MLNTRFIRSVGVSKWLTRYAYYSVRKHLLRTTTRLRLPTGLTLDLPRESKSATEVFVTNADVDWGSEEVFLSFADPARDFLDIGAHIGYYALYVAPKVRHVWAFEPDPRNISALRSNTSRAANVDIVEMAVSSTDGPASLKLGSNSAISRLDPPGDAAEHVPVHITTVDSFAFARGVQVGLVKIDVEEHELHVLGGMHRTVARDQPLILVEASYSQQLVNLCDEWNYLVFGFVRDPKTLVVQFRQLEGNELRERWYKMLFLCPQRFGAAFEVLVCASS
jgi:FkbM family methyltransferase